MSLSPKPYQVRLGSKQGITVGSRWYGKEVQEADRYTLTKRLIPSSTISGAFHYFLYKRKITSRSRFSPFFIQKLDGNVVIPSQYRVCPLGCYASPRQEAVFCPECGFPMIERPVYSLGRFADGLLRFFEGNSDEVVVDFNSLAISFVSTRNPMNNETFVSKLVEGVNDEDQGLLHHSEYLISDWLGFAYSDIPEFQKVICSFAELESIGKNKSRGYGKIESLEATPIQSFKSSGTAYVASPIPIAESLPSVKPKLQINLDKPATVTEKRFTHKAPNIPLSMKLIPEGLLLKKEVLSDSPLHLALWSDRLLQLYDYETATRGDQPMAGFDNNGVAHYSMRDLWLLGYGMLIPVEVKSYDRIRFSSKKR